MEESLYLFFLFFLWFSHYWESFCAVHSYAHIETFGACLDFLFWIKLTLLRRLFFDYRQFGWTIFHFKIFLTFLFTPNIFLLHFSYSFPKTQLKNLRKNVRKPILSSFREKLKAWFKISLLHKTFLFLSFPNEPFSLQISLNTLEYLSNRIDFVFPNLFIFFPYLCLNNNNLITVWWMQQGWIFLFYTFLFP